ncbi:hypothetical protein OG21DRAFT_1422225 [Imleria badia]|nr:hypothetical protein OG21DRAFT_1422225 [Imleria badia]
MYRTCKCKTINLVFGILPLCGVIPLIFLREDSGFVQKWFSVVPIGFGNAVIFQMVLSMSPLHAVSDAAFGQLFRGFGQTSGVAIASAVFQSRLDTELRLRIHAPDAENVSSPPSSTLSLVTSLPDPLQRWARDAYAASLQTMFFVAACSTLTAFLVRLPVHPILFSLPLSRARFLSVCCRFRKRRWMSVTWTRTNVRRDEGMTVSHRTTKACGRGYVCVVCLKWKRPGANVDSGS